MNLINEFRAARKASRTLAMLSEQKINSVILKIAQQARERVGEILAANAKDLAQFDATNPMYDRLLLTEERIWGIADDMENVAWLSSPVGEVISSVTRPNGMTIDKVRVPFGVIGVIYEARPNVSFDVFSLCFKSSNACILKGGSDAEHSNRAIVTLIRDVLRSEGVDESVVTLLPVDRAATSELLMAVEHVDLIIPRGGRSLIDYVRANSRVPVIETGAGVCHTYIDKFADLQKAADIVTNAKTRRVSVCNALDTIVVHSSRVADLPQICGAMAAKNVEIYADEQSFDALQDSYPAELLKPSLSSHYGMEFLDYKLSIRTVESLEQAVEHVMANTSHHSEAIVTEDAARGELYCKMVDAACLYVNVSTAFTDGAQFGMGAEIGISTQKMHARGPMALPELTVYKYIVRGDGQIRS
ncbi:MAG: glutamate-5-semialdehyde dehydrogenase [Rikenellaceae bacterium]